MYGTPNVDFTNIPKSTGKEFAGATPKVTQGYHQAPVQDVVTETVAFSKGNSSHLISKRGCRQDEGYIWCRRMYPTQLTPGLETLNTLQILINHTPQPVSKNAKDPPKHPQPSGHQRLLEPSKQSWSLRLPPFQIPIVPTCLTHTRKLQSRLSPACGYDLKQPGAVGVTGQTVNQLELVTTCLRVYTQVDDVHWIHYQYDFKYFQKPSSWCYELTKCINPRLL